MMSGTEAALLFRRKCPRYFNANEFSARFAKDAWSKALSLFAIGLSPCPEVIGFHIVFGPEQVAAKAEELGVAVEPGAKPAYYWARVSTVVLSQDAPPKKFRRGTNGKLKAMWI